MPRWVLLLSMFVASPAFAGEGLDLKDWLSRPGVKLLAVEFYATWCVPCKKAVPRWKALHEKYRDQGLRLIVVSVQDPDGACVNPGWNPDDVVCDTEGRLAQAWGVGDRLPAAFLWSWRGTLLVRKGHVDEVERAVEHEMRRLPRVTLDEGMDRYLREMLRTELARTGKVDVVAGAEEEKALAAIRKRSHELQFSEWSACQLGERLAANSLLKGTFVRAGSSKRLLLQLFSAETGCLNASAGVFWNKQRPELSVAEAVTELVNNLRVAVELPGGVRAGTIIERHIGEKGESWTMNVQSGVLVTFESEPPGAVVMVDGRLKCPSTPCLKTLSRGSHRVEMQKEKYLPQATTISVEQGMRPVHLRLIPDFGWVTVVSSPNGLPVLIDGKQVGTTPLQRYPVSTGPHEVLVSDARYYDQGKQVQIDRGENETVMVELQAREGGLVVNAHDDRGNDLAAEVWLDGKRVGTTPLAKLVLIGSHSLRVVHRGRQVKRTVEVKERQVKEVAVLLRGPPRPTESSSGAGTWTDPTTGLNWQVTPTGGPMSWAKANTHCSELDLDGGGWRLPTIDELRTLIRGCPATENGGTCNVTENDCLAWLCRDVSCNGCNGGDGPGTGGMYWPEEIEGDCCWYWSSSPVVIDGNSAWGVGFVFGVVNNCAVSDNMHVRCVR